MMDSGEQDRFGCEEPTFYHLLKKRKQRVQLTIHSIRDKDGSLLTSSLDILHAFAEHFKYKYDTISISVECMKRIMDCGLPTVPDAANLALEEPVTLEETYQAIKRGKSNKATGYNGICLEFLNKTWQTTKDDLLYVMNEKYTEALVSDHQKFGIIVCLPKKPNASHKKITDP
jgi:hypothetical protein